MTSKVSTIEINGKTIWTVPAGPYTDSKVGKADPIVWDTFTNHDKYRRGQSTLSVTYTLKPEIRQWMIDNKIRYLLKKEGEIELHFFDLGHVTLFKLTWMGTGYEAN